MELLLVGAPGSGTRLVGRTLAERRGVRFVDLTGEFHERVDALAGMRLADRPDSSETLRQVIAADSIVADPATRARLYRGRRVAWLDVPDDRLIERLRAMRRQDTWAMGDVRTYIQRHLERLHPFYSAGVRVDGVGSISATIDLLEPILAEPLDPGTLVLRADIHQGLLELGEGILDRSLRHVFERSGTRRCVVVTTAPYRGHADTAGTVARAMGVEVDVVELPVGEAAKTVDAQEDLFRTLASRRLRRDDPMVAVGDDVLLEAATFAAAVYVRGVPLITIPVTTLGLIDTAIGGKGAIDVDEVGRNVLGAIHQPIAIILDTALVAEEPADERRAAMAEVIKYGLIDDAGLLSILEQGVGAQRDVPWPRGSDLLELVERCALVKRRLVIADERDTGGSRIALNLGHTLSHALEAASGYRLRHGEAVAYGLRAALAIGEAVEVTPRGIAARARRLLDEYGLAVEPMDIPPDDVMSRTATDKKRLAGRTRWVLVGPSGVVLRDDVPDVVVRTAVEGALGGIGR